MTGPYNSVIGVEKDTVIQRFLTAMPGRFETAKGTRAWAVVITVGPRLGPGQGHRADAADRGGSAGTGGLGTNGPTDG